MMDLRVVTYQPGATSFEIVDAVPEITWYDRQGQTPMLTLSWLEGATGWKNLSGMVEVAVQYHDGNGWVEPRNGRFTIGQVSWERLTDTTRTRRFTNPGYVAQLSAYSVDTRLGGTDTDGKRQFNSVTPGALLVTLINEGKSAGYFPYLQVGFTTTHDSNGDPWPMVYNRAYGSGVKLSGVLQNLFDTGAVEYWMHGRVLQAAPTVGTDYTTGTDPVWIRDLIANSSPEEEDWTNLINKVVVNGEAGLRWEFTNPEANTVWGNRVETISAGGVNDEGTARVLADKILLAGQDAKRSYTREWVETVLPVMPGRDLVCGDWVKVDTALGSGARMRIASQGLRKTSSGALTGFVTVGTVTDDLLTKLAKRTVGIEGGSGVVSNGRPAPVTPVAATPKAPSTPTVTPTAYLDSEGRQQGLLTVSWPPVVESTLGDLIEVDHYVVGWRVNLADKGWAPLTSSSSPVGVSPVPVGQSLTVAVKAVAGNGQESAWSTAWVGVVPTDAVPPAQPKAPVLATRLGVVTVAWDGKNASNGSMPADFDRCEIERESVGLIGSLLRAGDFVTVPDQTPGVAQRYRLIAVDRVGNRSTPSVWVSITTAKLVSGDLDPGISTSIAAAQAKADTAFANAGIAQSGVGALSARGTNLVTNGNAQFGNTNFSKFIVEMGDTPTGAHAAFRTPSSNQTSVYLDTPIQVDPNLPYLASFTVRQTTPGVTSRAFFGLSPRDAFGNSIFPQHYREVRGTRTTLAAALNVGDTTVALTSTKNWNPAGLHITFWDYIDPSGKQWQPGTYSRNIESSAGVLDGDTIVLTKPWAGPTKPAGTIVSNSLYGSTFLYAAGMAGVLVPAEWTTFTATRPFSGLQPTDGENGYTDYAFPVATASVYVVLLANYAQVAGQGVSRQLFANLTLSETGAATQAAATAQTTANSASTAASAAQTTANSASTAASSAQSSANSAATAAATAQTAAIKKLTRSHLPPSTTVGFPTDAVWWRYGDATLTGPVIQQFTLGATSWVETPIGDQAIANLSVDKLVATGTSVFNTLVVQRLIAMSAFIEQLLTRGVVVAGDPTNKIGEINISQGAITTPALAANLIESQHLKAGAVETEHLGARAVTAEKIELKAIDKSKLAEDVAGTLNNADAWAAVTKIEPGKITLKSTTGTGATNAQMVLTPTRLSMEAGGDEVAYIDSSEQTLAITRARVSESIQVGRHIIESYNSDITLMRWVG